MFNKIKTYFLAHKVRNTIIVIVVVLFGFWLYKKSTSTSGEVRYVTGTVTKGTIVASVTGTGQVSADDQIDIKPKASGDVVYVGAKNGDRVASGALIAELDPKDAQKTVRDAQTALESANLSLAKLKIQNSQTNLSADETKAYENGLSAVSDAFLDFPNVVNGLDSLLTENNLSYNSAGVVGVTAQDYRNKAEVSYFKAKDDFDRNQRDYAPINTNSSKADIEKIIEETGNTSNAIGNAVKDMLTFVNYMSDQSNTPADFSSYQTTLSSYTSKIASHISALTTAESNISSSKDTSQNAGLDIQSAELAVTQKQNALQDAKDNLADYFVRAPFAGTVTNITIKKSDLISASNIVATLITDKQLAEISMNEVDVAKIKLGEKATLTFDAVSGLTITGTVEEIDTIGTVSQGVVTYNVKIAFDTQDSRVKSEMSVSAAIITDSKQDVLVVPNSAVKSQNGTSYAEMFSSPLMAPTDGGIGSPSAALPDRVPVEIGLSNDSETEIVSGLNEGDEIVVRTINPSAASAAAPSIFGSAPATRGGNANFRAPAGR